MPTSQRWSASPATAHFHVERAKKKLGVRTRVEAVAVGVLHGII
jgi:DNA-binding CsgD family transcriptional regulator